MNFKTRILNIFRLPFQIPALEKRLREKTFDTEPDSFYSKLVPNNYQYKPGSMRKFSHKGINYNADIFDFVEHSLYFGFRDNSQEKMFRLTRPGDIVLDIGTNIGVTLFRFAQRVKDEGRVYGFEPDPRNFKSCMDNIGLNSFNNIEVSKTGLGESPGEFNMVVNRISNRGMNRIVVGEKQASTKFTETIKVEKLDDWILDKSIPRVNLIKIDVEGFELKVLKGALETIGRNSPVLFIELDDNNLKDVGDSACELLKYLESINYQIKDARTDAKVSSSDNLSNCHFDIIAVK